MYLLFAVLNESCNDGMLLYILTVYSYCILFNYKYENKKCFQLENKVL